MKGKLIAIEGIDGSGKATQAKLLVNNLNKRGVKSKLVEFPRYTEETSSLIRGYLSGEFGDIDTVGPYRASIFYAVDRYADSFELKELLQNGYYVIADRYVSSNKGHQGSKISNRKDLIKFLVWLNDLEYVTMGIPIPDKTVLLDIPANLAFENVVARAESKGSETDKHDTLIHLRKSAKTYRGMTRIDPYEDWQIVKVVEEGRMRSVDDIQSDLLGLVL